MAKVVTFNGDTKSVSRSNAPGMTYWTPDRVDLTIRSAIDPTSANNKVLAFDVNDSAGSSSPTAFDRYQGATIVNGAAADGKFALPTGSEFNYRFFIDPNFSTDSFKQTSGVWAVMQDGTGDVSDYSIAEFIDADATAALKAPGATLYKTGVPPADFTQGFRFYNAATDTFSSYQQINATGWVDVKFALTSSSYVWTISQNGSVLKTYTEMNPSAPPAGETISTIIVDSQNFGRDQTYLYDDVTLVRANAPLTDAALTGGRDGTSIIVGTGNPQTNFVSVDSKDLELSLSVRETFNNNPNFSLPIAGVLKGGIYHFARDEGADNLSRVAYSVAALEANTSLADKLAQYDIKMTYDTDSSAGENSATFILRAKAAGMAAAVGPGPAAGPMSGYEWVFDANKNGKIDVGENQAITDDGGSAAVTQNIQNIAWYDANLASDILVKGSYDVRLQAFDKGTTTLKSENHIVIDVDGGAPAGGGGGGGGGGTTPTTPTPTTPTPTPTAPGAYNGNIPALIVSDFVNGGTPASAAKLADLAAFASLQFSAYQNQGVANPGLGPYEALGRGFAETSTFQTKYGSLSESVFISTTYKAVFGKDATPAQQQHFQDQIDYFEAIYEKAKISPAQAEILSKGAVLGQMLGVATLEGPSSHPYLLEANNFLIDVAKNVSDYGKPLSAFDII